MELLIPGLIIVALMVWASTKIKRNAARAYESELIEGDGFTLEKPEGFLNRIGSRDGHLFDAYSKDFGTDSAADIRAATAVVYKTDTSLYESASLEQSRLTNSDRSERFLLDGSDCIIVTGQTTHDDHAFVVSEKFLSSGGRTLVLKVEALQELSGDLKRKIEEMLLSFTIR
jgi:hypothetical protein